MDALAHTHTAAPMQTPPPPRHPPVSGSAISWDLNHDAGPRKGGREGRDGDQWWLCRGLVCDSTCVS